MKSESLYTLENTDNGNFLYEGGTSVIQKTNVRTNT